MNDFCFAVDPIDHTGGQHDLLTEDPRPRIDDQPACAGLVVGVVDLTDVAVEGFDRISGQVATRGSLVGVSPYSSLYVSSTSSSTHNHHLPFFCWCHMSKEPRLNTACGVCWLVREIPSWSDGISGVLGSRTRDVRDGANRIRRSASVPR